MRNNLGSKISQNMKQNMYIKNIFCFKFTKIGDILTISKFRIRVEPVLQATSI